MKVRGPPSGYDGMRPLTCSSTASPHTWWDIALGGVSLAGGVGASVSARSTEERAQVLVAGVGLAGLFAVSAIVGPMRVADCERALAKYESFPKAVRESRLVSVPVRLRNEYAESVISVSVELRGAKAEPIEADGVRLLPGQTVEIGRLSGVRPGDVARFEVSALSLGEERSLGFTDVSVPSDGSLTVVYDWDMASARFRARVERSD